MKILELTNYSKGACGVFARALQESKLLSRKHEVAIFSSNKVKGSGDIAAKKEDIGKINLRRFPAFKLGGESFMIWFNKEAKKQAIQFNPDVIIAHSYRHPHTISALRIAKKTKSKVFLVTHAPFVEKNSTRSLFGKLGVLFFDLFLGRPFLNKFDKIIAITNWEIPILEKFGAKRENIICVPNGIPEEFFNQKKVKEEKKILFLGRIAPVKDLETLLRAIPLINDKNVRLELVGPPEKDYLEKLKSLITQLSIEKRVIISQPIYDIKNKIKKIDSAQVFVLPSKTEAMPQSLIEAMAREKIVIASDNRGTKALINDGENGLIFSIGNEKELAEKINLSLKTKKDIGKKAKLSVKRYSWKKLLKEIESLLN